MLMEDVHFSVKPSTEANFHGTSVSFYCKHACFRCDLIWGDILSVFRVKTSVYFSKEMAHLSHDEQMKLITDLEIEMMADMYNRWIMYTHVLYCRLPVTKLSKCRKGTTTQ